MFSILAQAEGLQALLSNPWVLALIATGLVGSWALPKFGGSLSGFFLKLLQNAAKSSSTGMLPPANTGNAPSVSPAPPSVTAVITAENSTWATVRAIYPLCSEENKALLKTVTHQIVDDWLEGGKK